MLAEQQQNTPHCRHCGTENAIDSKFCGECGSPLSADCRSCGASNRVGARYCGQCGESLRIAAANTPAADANKPAARAEPSSAERRQLTVLFADLAGSTALSHELDPEELREVIREYQNCCAQAIGEVDGYIHSYLGDGVLAYFGFPQAFEDNAVRAASAALDIVERVKALNASLLEEYEIEIACRVAVHTGLVVLGEIGAADTTQAITAIGATPNVAARLEGEAAPNSVVVSADTQRLIARQFECESIGERQLKGVAKPVTAYALKARREQLWDRRKELPLIGRDSELAELQQRWNNAASQGQCLLLLAEPGMGKTRLLQELNKVTEHGLWLRCSLHLRHSSYGPLLPWLKSEMGNQPDSIAAWLDEYQISAANALPLLATLLQVPGLEAQLQDITPDAQRLQTMQLLTEVLQVATGAAAASAAPKLIIIEDLHWCDPSLLQLINTLSEQVASAPSSTPLFLCLSCRPEAKPAALSADIDSMSLAPLSSASIAELATAVSDASRAAGHVLNPEMLAQIQQKTDGVPLFVEELTQMVLGQEQATDSDEPIIPASLQDLLSARLDRMGMAKRAAQVGAVLGREFSLQLLEKVTDDPPSRTLAALEALEQAGLLHCEIGHHTNTYSFKHALIQDAAYHSLLRRARRQYHLRAANALQELQPDITERQPELVASHYRHARVADKAIPLYQAAGMSSYQRSAYAEATTHLQHALALLEASPKLPARPETELQIRMLLGPSLIALQGFGADEVGDNYRRAGQLCDTSGTAGNQTALPPELLPVVWGQWVFYLVRSDFKTAMALSANMLKMGEQHQNSGCTIEALWTSGNTDFWISNFSKAKTALDKALAIYDAEQHGPHALLFGQDPKVAAHCYSTYVSCFLGRYDDALTHGDAAMAHADSIAHPFSRGWALGFNSLWRWMARDVDGAMEWADRTIQFCTEQAYPFWLLAGLMVKAWATSQRDDHGTALALMEQGLAGWQQTGSKTVTPLWHSIHAEILLRADQLDNGLRAIDAGLEHIEQHGETASEIELLRIQGQLLIQYGDAESAEASLLRAAMLAEQSQALGRSLQVAISLAQLRVAQNRPAEAVAILQPQLAAVRSNTTGDFPILCQAQELLQAQKESLIE